MTLLFRYFMATTTVIVLAGLLLPFHIFCLKNAARGWEDLEKVNSVVARMSPTELQQVGFLGILERTELPPTEKIFLRVYTRAGEIYLGLDGFFYWGVQGNTSSIQNKFSCVPWLDLEPYRNAKAFLLLVGMFSMVGLGVYFDRCRLHHRIG